ncbi:MAG: tyrosine-type recombinase/integrase [Nitrososphaerota archaeon]|nr:site-specific integrase [Candidatus Bathyarchaeota archaeon]MDW8022908.1 tyrosine-type recombinase/integrase [Nitrososphaerota archaeon]
MKSGIYDYEGRLRRYRRLIAGLRNGGVALSFLDHLCALGLSLARVSKVASHLPALLRMIDFDIGEATRADVERVVAAINGDRRWREWTKHDKKLVLGKLIQYAKCGGCERGKPLPPEVSWIKLNVRDTDNRVTPEALLTREDFEALIRAAENRRDKAMLYVMFEGALRPGELLSMNVGSVLFRSNYCLIAVNGKTGLKRLPLVVSYGPLLDWLEEHPRRSDPNAPLWCSLAANRKGERLSYTHFRQKVKRLANRALLKKDVWPYLFRYSMLTALAKVFTEAKLEKYAGWVHGSKMSARYVHFSARDLEDAVLELHGLKNSGRDEDGLKLVECPRCDGGNPPGNARCKFCSYILDERIAVETEMDVELRITRLEEMVNQLASAVGQLVSSAQPTHAGLQLPAQQPSQETPSRQQHTPSQAYTHHNQKSRENLNGSRELKHVALTRKRRRHKR